MLLNIPHLPCFAYPPKPVFLHTRQELPSTCRLRLCMPDTGAQYCVGRLQQSTDDVIHEHVSNVCMTNDAIADSTGCRA